MIELNVNSKPNQGSLSVVTIADKWPNHTDFSYAVKPIEGESLTKILIVWKNAVSILTIMKWNHVKMKTDNILNNPKSKEILNQNDYILNNVIKLIITFDLIKPAIQIRR